MTFLALKLMQFVIAIGSLSIRLTVAINLVTLLTLKLMQQVIYIGSLSTRLTIAINLVTFLALKLMQHVIATRLGTSTSLILQEKTPPYTFYVGKNM